MAGLPPGTDSLLDRRRGGPARRRRHRHRLAGRAAPRPVRRRRVDDPAVRVPPRPEPYLAWLGEATPVRTLADIIAFNERDRERSMPYFGQEILLLAEATGTSTSRSTWRHWRRRSWRRRGSTRSCSSTRWTPWSRPRAARRGPSTWCTGDHFLGSAARRRRPWRGTRTSPCPWARSSGLPVGLSFFGTAWSEPRLIALAYAYEQATRHRAPPGFAPRSPVLA
jgi:amidase